MRRAGLPGRSVRERAKYPGVEDRRARHAQCRSARIMAIRAASSGCACSRTPISTRRRRSSWDPAALFHRSDLLQRQESGAAVPGRHVLRLLPCRAEPDQPAGRTRRIRNGRISVRRSARSTCGSTGCSSMTPTRNNFMYPARPHLPAGRDGHLAGVDRLHQQPADDERGLRPRRRGSTWRCAGARRRWPAASSNNKQFNDFVARRTADAILRDAEHRLDAARAEGRRPIRSARSARSTASTSISACSARNGCCTSIRSSAASRSRRSRSPWPSRIRAYWQATEAQTPHTALFFLKAARPDQLKDAPGGDEIPDHRRRPVLDRGKQVFADTCARCHSSKAPKPAAGLDPERLRRAGLSRLLEPLLGLDEDRRLTSSRCARSSTRRDFLDDNYPVDRARACR